MTYNPYEAPPDVRPAGTVTYTCLCGFETGDVDELNAHAETCPEHGGFNADESTGP